MSNPLKIALFEVDVTPPLGTALCQGGIKPADRIVDPLTCRGIVLLAEPHPLVLCAVDWLGIGNGGYRDWQLALAKAAKTTRERVSVHTVHQHDTPGHDTTVGMMLESVGLPNAMYNQAFAQTALERVAEAVRKAVARPRAVTHMGTGVGQVYAVASNRRILGPDGKVKHIRLSKSFDPLVRSEPEGLIDPMLKLVSFWNGDKPVASLTYYATHPQSHYGNGGVSWDFPGLARVMREQELPRVAHIHFTGAAGNIAAGKYNDGTPENRPVLARRLADGMAHAFANTIRHPIDARSFEYRVLPVALPVREDLLDVDTLRATLHSRRATVRQRITAARDLAWVERCQAGDWPIELTALRAGSTWIVGTPGELCIEYQLAALKMRPKDTICLAAYADYAPGYICPAIAFEQGGYEPTASRTSPAVEKVFLKALRKLLA